MSRYGLNSLLYRVRTDAGYRQRFRTQPDSAIDEWEISEEERAALRNWDVKKLNHLGVYLHILIGTSNILRNPEQKEDFAYDAEALTAKPAENVAHR